MKGTDVELCAEIHRMPDIYVIVAWRGHLTLRLCAALCAYVRIPKMVFECHDYVTLREMLTLRLCAALCAYVRIPKMCVIVALRGHLTLRLCAA